MKNFGFTLIEVLVVSVIISFVFILIISFYFHSLDIKVKVLAREDLMKSSYFLIEKLNILMKDYKVDYEEYFNRRLVGCDSDGGDNFSWNVGDNGYCDKFTAYGNGNPVLSDTGYFHLYWCSSKTGDSNNVILNSDLSTNTDGCRHNNDDGSSFVGKYQSFGEYAKQFWDVKDDSDGTGNGLYGNSAIGDDDDVNLGKGPVAIGNWTGVQELYLISKDDKRRLFIRRALVDSGDFDNDGTISAPYEKRYDLQMLRLRGFDAGDKHNFCTNSSTCSVSKGVYDGIIDTWACDYSYGFVCHGDSIGGAYTNYYLPKNTNDGWVDVFPPNITIQDRDLQIYPNKDPSLAWKEDSEQINPYIRLRIRVGLYGGSRNTKINPRALSGYIMDLETTFNIKTFY